jgi:hypothetical protein
VCEWANCSRDQSQKANHFQPGEHSHADVVRAQPLRDYPATSMTDLRPASGKEYRFIDET